MSILIKNAHIITNTEAGILNNHAIYIQDGLIAEMGPDVNRAAGEVIDASGGLVMPGSIVAHTHFYGAYARGMAIPGPAPKDFLEILQKLWWCLDKALDEDVVRLSALVHLVDAIKHGATTLIDHHASPNFIDRSLDVIADAVEQAGVRAVLCYEVTDRDGPERAEAGIAENVRFLKAAKHHPMVAATFGLHASLTLSDETLAACVEAAQGLDTGFHIHVAEHEADEYDSINRYGKRVVQRLAEAGILGERSIVAHAVHCDPWELELLRDTGTWVTHQARSNMNNAVGAANIDAMLAADMKLCLGTDGFSNNMWAEWKTAYLLHKLASRDPRRASGDGIARMALVNNAYLARQFFPDTSVGQLAVGAVADLIMVDYHPYTPLTAGNLPWHIIFGFESSMIRTTIAAGKLLMCDRQILTLDEQAIAQEARELAPAVWARYEKYVQELASTTP
ncbi:MAG: putative aminohydrolase SsnA [Chloroflexi bacterium]|nr:putative aminohydrolase SsnA [Chloroflexota bacterium]